MTPADKMSVLKDALIDDFGFSNFANKAWNVIKTIGPKILDYFIPGSGSLANSAIDSVTSVKNLMFGSGPKGDATSA